MGFGIQPVARSLASTRIMACVGIVAALLTPWLWGSMMHKALLFLTILLCVITLNAFLGNLHGHGGHPLYYVFVMPLVLLPYSGLVDGDSVENS